MKQNEQVKECKYYHSAVGPGTCSYAIMMNETLVSSHSDRNNIVNKLLQVMMSRVPI